MKVFNEDKLICSSCQCFYCAKEGVSCFNCDDCSLIKRIDEEPTRSKLVTNCEYFVSVEDEEVLFNYEEE